MIATSLPRRTASRLLQRASLALTLLAPAPLLAAESVAVTSPRVTATLLSSRDAVAPGERFQVALTQKLAPGWHSYWQNPGDSGEATRIEWTLPEGVNAGAIQWPAPKAIRVEPLVNFGFEDHVLLPVEISVPASAKPGETLTLSAKATWLVCEKICIPEEGAFTLDLPVAPAGTVDTAAQARIDEARDFDGHTKYTTRKNRSAQGAHQSLALFSNQRPTRWLCSVHAHFEAQPIL